ncbi:hypothetical protein ASC61_08235 [Aeromicrobium sp. Root344]|uniref:hypothetical protein n=1 Tax=Aeromicrobium sp. Root344 TaxID=1736521 RepID=UPI0006FF22FD|nr:hypothetical protein [Aeromicrobium sp. Root344]KQV74986.1 hypothetical protein ASC61_08235 [Aeromicrobium sp. Root344]
MWGRKRETAPAAGDDGEGSAGLRRLVLSTSPADLGLAVDADPDRVYGVLMEIGYDAAVVTIVSLIDGTTSMYISTGGGTIGAGEHEPVAVATRSFVAMAQVFVGQSEPTTTFDLPGAGRVRFQLLTVGGGRTAEAAEDDLGRGRHPLSPLFHAGQDVITQIRLLSEQQTS